MCTIMDIICCIPIHYISLDAFPTQGYGQLYTLMTLATMQHLKHLHLIFYWEYKVVLVYLIIDVWMK